MSTCILQLKLLTHTDHICEFLYQQYTSCDVPTQCIV